MAEQPNIILIVADDMGYGDFGAFSEGAAKTPTIDRLVEEGVSLTQHYAASPVCAPSRAGLLTGRYPHRTGAIDTLEGRGLDRLALKETTLADLMKRSGYATGLVGKWHNGALDSRYHPNARGFDEFVGFRGGWQDYYRWRLDRNGAFEKSDGRYLTDVFADEAVQFVERHAAEPFFLHVAFNAPHFPFQAPEDEVAPFAETGRFTEVVSLIYAMIRRMDKGIERVLDTLARLGIEQNTLVMFTSDNGPQLAGEGERDTRRFNCNFNGAKGTTYEGGVRVPMVLRWPAGLDADRHYDEFVHFMDWLPTLLAIAGQEPPKGLALDGQNILPVLHGEPRKVNPRRCWQWNRYTPVIEGNAAIRDGDWKLIRPVISAAMQMSREDADMDGGLKYEPEKYADINRHPEPEREIPTPPPPLLYNIKDDPLECHDLAEADPDRAARMLRDLEAWFEEVEAERRD